MTASHLAHIAAGMCSVPDTWSIFAMNCDAAHTLRAAFRTNTYFLEFCPRDELHIRSAATSLASEPRIAPLWMEAIMSNHGAAAIEIGTVIAILAGRSEEHTSELQSLRH